MAASGRTLKYIGPHVAVEVPALAQVVARGKTITVEDTALADALLAQETNWQEISSKPAETKAAGKDGA